MSPLVPNPQNPKRPGQRPQGNPPGSEYTLQFGAFAGPLPPPEILQGYEQACPGAANRIIEMAESQGGHRRQMEKAAMEAQVEGMHRQFDEARLGQIFAFCVSGLFLISGTIAVAFGHPIPGSIFGTMGLSGIVGTFIQGRQGKPDESQLAPPPNPPAKKLKRNR